MSTMQRVALRSDAELRRDVIDQLESNPRFHGGEVGVVVQEGIVTLTGDVPTLAHKRRVEHAVQEVRGVRAVASELAAVSPHTHAGDDREIARAASSALLWDPNVPHEGIHVTVSRGVVTLEGDVDWPFQRDNAVRAVANLTGVERVDNRLHLKDRVVKRDVRQGIESALQRNASVTARRIRVEIVDNRATLTGTVHSVAEKHAAERAAWGVPGVVGVENRLLVEDAPVAFPG
jgi:osmotically-inducible protein OsmY